MKFDINGKEFELAEIIVKMFPNASFTVGDEFESLTWYSDNIDKPTLQQIETFVGELRESNVAPVKDWSMLEKQLTGTSLFATAYAAAKTTLAANAALTLVLNTVSSTRNEETLYFAIDDLLRVMKESSKIQEFDEVQMKQLKDILNQCGFESESIIIGKVSQVQDSDNPVTLP